MSFVFECSSLKYLPNIKYFNVNNVSRISGIFAECSNLISIPDISKWFIKPSNCLKIVEVPGAIWEIEDKNDYKDDILYIRYMFYNCASLKYLPDISKWNIIQVDDLSFFFMVVLL